MTELNGAGPFKVTKVNSPYNFCIEANTEVMGKFTSGGFITQVKVPFKVQYKKFETALQ